MHTTIGKIAIGLLKDEKYLDVLLPRIPVLIKRDIQEKLDKKYPALVGGYKGDRDIDPKSHRDGRSSAVKDLDRFENKNRNNDRKLTSYRDRLDSRGGYRDMDRNSSRYGDSRNEIARYYNKDIDRRKDDRDKSPYRKDDERRNRERYIEKDNHERRSRSPFPANPVVSEDQRDANSDCISAEDKKKREEAQKE